MIHELKILPNYFDDVMSGRKTFEVRKNDRDFRVGDLLALNEYDADKKEYTRNSCLVYVDYILKDDGYCKSGYVIMTIKPCSVDKIASAYNPITMKNDYKVPYATKKGEN